MITTRQSNYWKASVKSFESLFCQLVCNEMLCVVWRTSFICSCHDLFRLNLPLGNFLIPSGRVCLISLARLWKKTHLAWLTKMEETFQMKCLRSQMCGNVSLLILQLVSVTIIFNQAHHSPKWIASEVHMKMRKYLFGHYLWLVLELWRWKCHTCILY